MGETENITENTQKKSFFKGVKSEYKKIVWPTKETLGKETVSVITVSIVLGVIISLFDLVIKYGFDKILQLG